MDFIEYLGSCQDKERIHPIFPWNLPLLSQSKSDLWQLASSLTLAQGLCSLNAALCSPFTQFLLITWGTFKSSAVTGLHISCILWIFLTLTSYFFCSLPFHLLAHLFFVTSMCPSVCWLSVFCVVFVLRLFCLWCPRCLCALPRRRSFHGSCGPCCWCICWIWWVTKQLSRFVCERQIERVCFRAVVAFVKKWLLLLLLEDSRINMLAGATVSLQIPL